MEKELGDLMTSTSISLKIKNMMKLKNKAKENNKSVSSFLNKCIEEMEE